MADTPCMEMLVIDDEVEILQMLATRFELEEIKVTVASDVDTAIDLHEKKLFPVILTDIRMPGMSGIELPDEREKKGKPRCRKIRLVAELTKAHLYLTIEDDGKGIDPVVMRSVAIKKGFLKESEAHSLSDSLAIDLIFAAGLSSRVAITEVSGRGVGMDVVKTQIKNVNGSIKIEAAVGKETSFIVKLPLTTTSVVAPALVCELFPGKLLVIPIESVVEVACFAADKRTHLFDEQAVYKLREEIFPFLHLKELLFGDLKETANEKSDDLEPQSTSKHTIGVTKNGTSAVLSVDRLHGIQQVVEKKNRYEQ